MLDIVILAAGASKRLGRSKQLLELNNESLVCRTAKVAIELTDYFNLNRPHLISGKDHQAVNAAVKELPVLTHYNSNWQEGMGSSIASSIEHLNLNSSGVLFMTCDQVLLTSDLLKPLIETWQHKPDNIIASIYGDVTGIPVIFPAQYYTDISLLSSDKGAKSMLQKYKETVVSVEISAAAQDLDNEDDERKVRHLLETNQAAAT
jgi:molybdenum cofactor cytidylyltransferase